MVNLVAEGIAWHCRMCLCVSNFASHLGTCVLTCGPAVDGALAGLWLPLLIPSCPCCSTLALTACPNPFPPLVESMAPFTPPLLPVSP